MKAFYGWLRPSGCIHPYYERRLPEANTFMSGGRIAKDLPLLEKLAKETGKLPLTSLHFSSLPIDRKTLQWNLAEDGIKVVQEQIVLVSDSSSTVVDTRSGPEGARALAWLARRGGSRCDYRLPAGTGIDLEKAWRLRNPDGFQ